MATITGGRLRTPFGVMAWRPVASVAKAYEFVTRTATDKYVCLGVAGNLAHLAARDPGDHTMYSKHDVWVGGKHYVPKKGFVYAIDLRVPEPEKFEKWLLARLRAKFYPGVKYWNILHRHWARNVVLNGVPFARARYSGDDHLHVSVMPSYEYAVFDFLGDYEHFRTTGRNVGDKPKPAVVVKPTAFDAAARKLPVIKRGSKGVVVRLAQAGLVARGRLPKNRSSIDGAFGPGTDGGVKAQQRASGVTVTGVVDTATWDKIFPEQVLTVSRGSDGFYATLMQALLYARGFDPGPIDGDFGDGSVDALKRFQAARKVANSVVKGRGDGIGGSATWVALLTI